MGKRILIGSMLVLTLLLLMPSIPAIQQKTVEDKAMNDLKEKLETINLNDLKDIDVLDGIKYPILMLIVFSIPLFRLLRGLITYFLSFGMVDTGWHGLYIFGVKRQLLALWGAWILLPCGLWYDFWNAISDKQGWNWDLPEVG